jgi:YidC/Oxa1 family membrane protein insertase
MQAIQPEIDRIKEEYADNPEIINMRTSVLFQEKEVNPLAGCLPILLQFPIFIGLYRTLLNLGRDRVLEEPFGFIPSLMGPVVAGLPTDYVGVREDAPWLLQNWVDGHPPLGWHDTAIYCVLPALVVVAQLVSSSVTKAGQPKKPKEASGDGSMETLVAVLPFLIGWFSLNLPAGCALYWVVNTTFTTLQQVYIKSLFKPQLELSAVTAAAASTAANTNIVTEAERKMAEQVRKPRNLQPGTPSPRNLKPPSP